jgi:hypothetical protein
LIKYGPMIHCNRLLDPHQVAYLGDTRDGTSFPVAMM